MNPQMVLDLKQFYPELIITAALLAVVIADLALKRIKKSTTFLITAIGLSAAFAANIFLFYRPAGTLFFNMLAMDRMAVFFKGFLILASFLVLLATPKSREFSGRNLGEFYTLLMCVTLAMLLLSSSVDMLMLYLSLEMVSVGSYIMVGYLNNDRQSNEASLKYLLFGAVATGSMLYGMTLLYGLSGTTKFAGIREVLSHHAVDAGGNSAMLFVSATLILAGLGFKIAAVPFHFWCPDVYTGAPTPVTAFLSVAPKAAGFAALIRFFFTGLSLQTSVPGDWMQLNHLNWNILILIISIITMTLGNLAALRQENMKRMLAYSSIAHAGYILMGAVVLTAQGLQSILIYLITYLFMNLGAFIVVIEVFNRTGSFELKDYRGLLWRSPLLTIAMVIFMLSLMGIPPFAGFFGKLYVFGAAVNNNLAWFAVVGALNSVIAVYYYARVIKTMIIEDSAGNDSSIEIQWAGKILIWATLLPTIGLAVFWEKVQEITSASIKLFLGT